jgi:vitamin K-dependent gamma-carboxylase
MQFSISGFRAGLFSPVDIASLVAFRIAFGGIMLWEVIRYFSHRWIAAYWIEPDFHFTYSGFHWVRPWPEAGMYVHMGVLAVLAVFIAAGLFYRISTALFFAGFTYTFLLERALYLNHLYFVCLVSFLMVFVPAHRALSIDALLRPALRADVVPFWSLWILRMQLAIVYIFAGIAKFNSDWFRGEPLRTWLHDLNATPVIGPLFDRPEMFYVISWGGLAFDLFIVPLLVWRRTRTVAFIAAVCFHLANAWFFRIGVFPWFSIAMTTLFFEPDWPRRALRRFGIASTTSDTTEPAPQSSWIVAFIGLYMVFQILFPLRHWIYPGDVAWTEEGHEFSWRMKLRGKVGRAIFVVTDPATKETWRERPHDFLESWQVRKMSTRPELIRQFAHYLAENEKLESGAAVEVRVDSKVSLNGRPAAALIDPDTDLAREPHRIGPAKWITRESSRH